MDIENRLVDAWSTGSREGEMGERDQKIHISSYKMNESWGYNVQYGDYY